LDDPQEYLDILSELSSDNVFSTATDAVFADPDEPPEAEESTSSTEDSTSSTVDSTSSTEESTSSTTTSSTKNISGIVGAAVGFTLLAAGVVLYRRHKFGDTEDKHDRTLNKKACGGDATVASGETHTGETLDGSASTRPSTGYFRHEENVSLKSHTEEDDNSDMRKTPAFRKRLQRESSDEVPYHDRHLLSSSRQNRKLSDPPSVSDPFAHESAETLLQNEAKERPSESIDSRFERLRYENTVSMKEAYMMNCNNVRRPRTVAEIEMVLAMDTDV
jgi:hypothetical protein